VSDKDYEVDTSNDTNHTDIPVPDPLPPYVPDPVLPPITEPINVTPSQDNPPLGHYLHEIPTPGCPTYVVNDDPSDDPPTDDLPEDQGE